MLQKYQCSNYTDLVCSPEILRLKTILKVLGEYDKAVVKKETESWRIELSKSLEYYDDSTHIERYTATWWNKIIHKSMDHYVLVGNSDNEKEHLLYDILEALYGRKKIIQALVDINDSKFIVADIAKQMMPSLLLSGYREFLKNLLDNHASDVFSNVVDTSNLIQLLNKSIEIPSTTNSHNYSNIHKGIIAAKFILSVVPSLVDDAKIMPYRKMNLEMLKLFIGHGRSVTNCKFDTKGGYPHGSGKIGKSANIIDNLFHKCKATLRQIQSILRPEDKLIAYSRFKSLMILYEKDKSTKNLEIKNFLRSITILPAYLELSESNRFQVDVFLERIDRIIDDYNKIVEVVECLDKGSDVKPELYNTLKVFTNLNKGRLKLLLKAEELVIEDLIIKAYEYIKFNYIAIAAFTSYDLPTYSYQEKVEKLIEEKVNPHAKCIVLPTLPTELLIMVGVVSGSEFGKHYEAVLNKKIIARAEAEAGVQEVQVMLGDPRSRNSHRIRLWTEKDNEKRDVERFKRKIQSDDSYLTGPAVKKQRQCK